MQTGRDGTAAAPYAAAMPFARALRSPSELREVYRQPQQGALAKQLDHLDGHCRRLIAHAPFLVLATASAEGACDASPRGGPPGFVTVLDDHRLGIPDLAGNNRLDSMSNIVTSAGVALWFCIPGLDETLRVNGRAAVTIDPGTRAACTVGGIEPRVVIGVDVVDAYIHCAKALRRAGLWQPERWPDLSDLPSVPAMLRDHCNLPDQDEAAVHQRLEAAYATTMWQAGGEAG